MTVVAIACLMIDIVAGYYISSRATAKGFTHDILEVGLIIPFVMLVQIYSPWENFFKRMEKTAVCDYLVDISDGSIKVVSGGFEKRLERNEIRRAEEPKWGGGLYLRTSNRYRCLFISGSIEGFSDLAAELGSMGIRIERTQIPPNWEQYFFAPVYCGTLLLPVFVHERTLLIANLCIAALLGVFGWYSIRASFEKSPLMRNAEFGAWIPLVLAALALFLLPRQ